MQVSIKNVEPEVFREFKAESVREGLNIGKALSLAMKIWIEKHQKKSKVSILSLKPNDWGNGTEKTSEDISKIIY